MATRLCSMLHKEGFSAETDLVGRGLKAQMKFANKIGAKFTVVLGDDEIANSRAMLKNMSTGEQVEVNLPNGLLSAVYDSEIKGTLSSLTESLDSEMDEMLKGCKEDMKWL